MQQGVPTSNVVLLLQERLPEMPIIVLSKPLDPDSNILDVQDYVIGGETVIPLFSSKDSLTTSLHGADLGRPTVQIARALLAQVAKGNEVYLLDPQTENQLRFTAGDLRVAFPEPFVLK